MRAQLIGDWLRRRVAAWASRPCCPMRCWPESPMDFHARLGAAFQACLKVSPGT